jgi:serine protease AprX
MKFRVSQTLQRRFFGVIFVFALVGVLFGQSFAAAKLSPALRTKLNGLANSAQVGMVVVAFKTNNGLQNSHLNILRSVGVLGGQTFPTLGMVAQPMTAGQVRALQNNSAVRSIWSNDRLHYYMHQARVVGGAARVETDRAFAIRNGGLPVSGAGDFSVLVIDSGIDATHADLQFGTKVIQNVQTPVAAGTLPGFTPHVSIENVPNTDQSVGHGTHCAGIIGGTGVRSGGLYPGVAPGAKIIGAGLGAGIFVINGLAAWEWGLANQYRYNIRVVSNSYGGDGPFDPEDPITIASKMAYDRNITVVFAGGNAGPVKDTYNPLAKAPWVIGVAAGSKEGDLADFSSRGMPREQRLSNSDPLDDNNAPTITAPGMGRAFESSLTRAGFTIDMISTRSTSNLVANGTTNDTELAPGMIPFYTQIHGTSMATPYVAGVVALMLDADPNLTPDEIKEILTSTASKMPGRSEWEVGAGYINAYAAVDKVFNRTRNYAHFQDVSFNAVFSEQRPAQQNFHLDFNPAVSGATSTNATTFTVEAGMNVLDVFATVDSIAGGTGNLVGIRITSPSGVNYSTAIDYPVIGTDKRQIVVQNPEAGTWTLEVRGARGLTAAPQASSPIQLAMPGPVDGNVTQIKYTLPNIADIQGHPQQAAIEAALKNRVVDIYADGTFKPNDTVTREDFARSLVLNTSLRQTLSATPRFGDVSGDLARIAEAVTANGSTLRDFNYVPDGMMTGDDNFYPNAAVTRIDMAIAFVRALGYDTQARNLANSDVTSNGAVISDNGQIPAELRGYVQIALDKGLFEAFPAGVVEIAPGQFQVLPGPRFEPNTTVNRATLAIKLNSYRQLFTTGG